MPPGSDCNRVAPVSCRPTRPFSRVTVPRHETTTAKVTSRAALTSHVNTTAPVPNRVDVISHVNITAPTAINRTPASRPLT